MISVNKRLVTLFLIGFLLLLILFRFFQLQVIDYKNFKDRAINKVIRIIPISAPRGLIKDRNNLVIVNNANSYDFQLVPYDVRNDFNYKLLLNYINIDTLKIKDKVSQYKNSYDKKFTPISLKNKLSQDIVFKVREQKEEFPGLVIREVFIRDYLHNSNINLAHVLSEVKIQNKTSFDPRKDRISLEPEGGGVEKYYNQKLKGIPGREYRLFDASGMDREIYSGDLYNHIMPIEGKNLNLTIDIKLQEFVYQMMQGFEGNKHEGTIILSDPETGEILAYVNSPTFDIEKMLIGISHSELDSLNKLNTPFFNRGVNPYLSGSIMKIPSAITLLEEGFDKNTVYDCNGKFILDPQSNEEPPKCWSDHKDSVNLKTAISESCNVFFWQSVKYNYNSIYKDKWAVWTNKLGFSNLTNIELLYEKEAIIDSSHLAKSHMINKSIGQGESKVTPIQVIQMINVIANDGYLIRPHLNKDLDFDKKDIGIKKSTLLFVQDAMRATVESGTADFSNIENVVVRAKTGTAELGRYKDINKNGIRDREPLIKDVNGNGKYEPDLGDIFNDVNENGKRNYVEPQYMNAWYGGYMEYGNKKVSLVIFLQESAHSQQRGGKWATRMARRILNKFLEFEGFSSD